MKESFGIYYSYLLTEYPEVNGRV